MLPYLAGKDYAASLRALARTNGAEGLGPSPATWYLKSRSFPCCIQEVTIEGELHDYMNQQ